MNPPSPAPFAAAAPVHLTIVTGSSRGVGAALVARLLVPGQRVLGIARRANEALAAQAGTQGVAFEQWTMDLADPLPAAERLAAWLGGLDARGLASATLVNNAGALGKPAVVDRTPLYALSQAMRVGAEAPLLLSAAFLAATEGWTAVPRRVLNISSGLGRRAMAGSAAYCGAKAALDHVSRALALEQAGRPNPARIVAMAPGVIDTDMQAELRGADAALFPERERFAELQRSGALISPDECARRLLARLARDDFGHEVIADLRDA